MVEMNQCQISQGKYLHGSFLLAKHAGLALQIFFRFLKKILFFSLMDLCKSKNFQEFINTRNSLLFMKNTKRFTWQKKEVFKKKQYFFFN